MSVEKFTDAGIFVGAREISGKSNKVSLEYKAAMLDGTVFGQTTKVNVAGLVEWQMSAEGFNEFGTDVPATGVTFMDSAAANAPFTMMGGLDLPLTVLPNASTDLSIAYFMKAVHCKYDTFGKLGDLLPFSLETQPSKHGTRGFLGFLPSSRTASANGSSKQLGAVSSSQRLVAALHVIQFNGTSLDVVIASDDDTGFPSGTTRITFAQATGITSEWAEVAGPITDDWFRAQATFVGTSFKALVVFGLASIF